MLNCIRDDALFFRDPLVDELEHMQRSAAFQNLAPHEEALLTNLIVAMQTWLHHAALRSSLDLYLAHNLVNILEHILDMALRAIGYRG